MPQSTHMNFDALPPAAKQYLRQLASKGGKAGRHEDKVRAGRLGMAVRWSKKNKSKTSKTH